MFRPQIRSRHPSHSVLRKGLPLLPFKSIVRMGSTTVNDNDIEPNRVVVNSADSIRNSSSKLRMKECFTTAKVKTAPWIRTIKGVVKAANGGDALEGTDGTVLMFPIVCKQHYGSRGNGNTLVQNAVDFEEWKKGKTLANYIFEEFMNYALEFRFHITEDGYFYACRKALKKDVPESEKWRRHDDICVWFMEENPDFQKPNSWNDIISDCVKALKAIGADVLSFDVKVQSAKSAKGENRGYQEYILIECNSASSFGDVTAAKYIEEIPKILKRKYSK